VSQFSLPTPPTFDRLEDDRLHRQQRLAAAFRLFAHYGFDEGIAGHITVRDPEYPDCFWVNPVGMYFGHIRVSDLLLVNHQGEVVKGNKPVNKAAFAIHSQIHQARPDMDAAAHSGCLCFL
jgi:ribulose-5-phosphate 4-epimerase/fuculose-1-phosphate aldolase